MSEIPEGWGPATEHFTRRLVAISSVSPGAGETEAAREVLRLLRADGLHDAYTESGLNDLPGDPHGRANAYALIRGTTSLTVVMLGHLDTVGTSDYGDLEPLARSPDGLAANFELLRAMAPEVDGFNPSEWLYGRGAADMKSGVAATIAVMRHLARRGLEAPLPFSVVVVATMDEENESAGVVEAVHLLTRLRNEHGLAFAGAINTDYVSERFPGDTARPLYAGTVGKLLPSFLAIGAAGHAGHPFGGLDANLILAELIRDLSLNPDLADIADGIANSPPVSLRATDLKERYDTQLALAAHLALNLVTVSVQPGELLTALRARSAEALQKVLERSADAEERWRERAGLPRLERRSRTPRALTYAEVAAVAEERIGRPALDAELAVARRAFTAAMDSRRRCLALVEATWRLSGLHGPAVVVYYAPPFYPHLAPRPSSLLDAVEALAGSHPDLELVMERYFPLLSDLSYLGHQEGSDVDSLIANMPIWRPESRGTAGYWLPLEEIRRLDMPVVNIGPYGFGVHQAGERVHRAYSFEVLPQLILETIERVGASGGIPREANPEEQYEEPEER